jgi:DNA-directed RNA polymerase specialized sigma subunit
MTSENPGNDEVLAEEAANALVLEHQGWAESIARAVARAWNLDWRLDGLDGAAMEALVFCSRRFTPGRGIPFRGYARKRIHEASSEAARKSKGWRRGSSGGSSEENRAREVSAELYNIFPELRDGMLPGGGDDNDGGGDDSARSAVRQLLMGASLVAVRQSMEEAQPDDLIDYKRMIGVMAQLDPIHQMLMYKVYWDGLSLRTVAADWETDGLNVMREHKVLLTFLQKSLMAGKPAVAPKVRPGLKSIAVKLRKDGSRGPFADVLHKSSS